MKPEIEGRKEMFYFTTHSTHFIYGYMASVNALTTELHLAPITVYGYIQI